MDIALALIANQQLQQTQQQLVLKLLTRKLKCYVFLKQVLSDKATQAFSELGKLCEGADVTGTIVGLFLLYLQGRAPAVS